MAKRKKRNNLTKKGKGWWYYRLCWGTGVNHREKTIPLKTKDKSVANRLGKKVDAIADDVRNGIYSEEQIKDLLPWLNDAGTSEIKEHTLEGVTPQYLDYKKSKLREKSVKRDRVSINQLCEFIGYSKPIADIDYLDIEGKKGLIQHLQSTGYSNNGINVTLRHLRTFFNWLHKKAKIIDEPIQFDMLPKVDCEYYIDEYQIQAIHNYIDDDSNGIDSFFKRCFIFYEITGVRAIEPFIGELYGDWLYVDASKSKGKNLRKIHLSEELKAILMEMQSFRDEYVARNSPNPDEQAYGIISKKLLRITRALNFNTNRKITIKSFRHHYGIKRVYLTGNIFQVAMEMGHKSVTTTQHYLRFQLDELKDYFPSLIPIIDNLANIDKNVQDGNKKMGTQYSNVSKLYT
jgi:site-specific recombinase XerD|tara:strand:- start:42 stop:1250 length:1209 start_codon:yes stop_codon:yes gene_type:complete